MGAMIFTRSEERLAAFEDTGELVVQLLAELNQCDGLRREDLAVTRSAVLLLSMYGALALASREANADRDDEECLA